MRRTGSVLLVAVLLVAPLAARANHGVVEDARATLWEMLSDPDFASLRDLLAQG